MSQTSNFCESIIYTVILRYFNRKFSAGLTILVGLGSIQPMYNELSTSKKEYQPFTLKIEVIRGKNVSLFC